MTTKEPIRLQLSEGITAQVDWQNQMPEPFWVFGYGSSNGGPYQPCMLAGQDPLETLYRGIRDYDLPLPLARGERAKYITWRLQNDAT